MKRSGQKTIRQAAAALCAAACLLFPVRAAEIHADAILLAKNIDGVYDADPARVPTAKRFDRISYREVLARGLGVMDTAATALAMDNHIPLLVFALKDPKNIRRVLLGEAVGTYVGTDV